MMMPIDVLYDAEASTGWNDQSKIAVLCDFLQFIVTSRPEILTEFHQYVTSRVDDELEAEVGP